MSSLRLTPQHHGNGEEVNLLGAVVRDAFLREESCLWQDMAGEQPTLVCKVYRVFEKWLYSSEADIFSFLEKDSVDITTSLHIQKARHPSEFFPPFPTVFSFLLQLFAVGTSCR